MSKSKDIKLEQGEAAIVFFDGGFRFEYGLTDNDIPDVKDDIMIWAAMAIFCLNSSELMHRFTQSMRAAAIHAATQAFGHELSSEEIIVTLAEKLDSKAATAGMAQAFISDACPERVDTMLELGKVLCGIESTLIDLEAAKSEGNIH